MGREEFSRNRIRFKSVQPHSKKQGLLANHKIDSGVLIDMDAVEKGRFLGEYKKFEKIKISNLGLTESQKILLDEKGLTKPELHGLTDCHIRQIFRSPKLVDE